MGIYDPLRDYLAGHGNSEISLSFAEIEAILGRALPPSAYNYDAWWAGSAHSQSQAWLDAGFQVRADRKAQKAVFTRDLPPIVPKPPYVAHRVPPPDWGCRPGDRVRHDTFGNGTVLSLTPMGRDAVIEVDFDQAGRKKLMMGVAKDHLNRIAE